MSRALLVLVLAGGAGLAPAAIDQPSAAANACAQPSGVLRVTPASARSSTQLTVARCVQRDLEEGRWADAEVRLDIARQAATELPHADRRPWHAFVLRLEAARRVDVGPWAALMDTSLPHEEVLPWVGPLVRGIAAARTSWARQDAALQARGRAELARLDLLAGRAGSLSEAERARLMVQAALAGAQYERDEMQLLLDAAHDLEVRLLPGDPLWVPVVLAWELEADLLLLTDRYAAAGGRYRDLLVEWPRRVQARIGLAEAYRRLGFAREAEVTLSQARALWATADVDAVALIK